VDLVKEFVGAGHNDLAKVKAMLAEQPGLIKAAYDWGGGDFETALGGAGHMGQREIAEYLIAHGAPVELHAAAMLGKLDFVKAAVAAFPNAAQIPGPHTITLIAHARKGGPAAQAVVDFLEGLK
jgi:ankyrin repeat protein